MDKGKLVSGLVTLLLSNTALANSEELKIINEIKENHPQVKYIKDKDILSYYIYDNFNKFDMYEINVHQDNYDITMSNGKLELLKRQAYMQAIIDRMGSDINFREQVKSDSNEALKHYTKLSKSEIDAISSMRRVALQELGLELGELAKFTSDNGFKLHEQMNA